MSELVAALRQHARTRAHATALTFLGPDGRLAKTLTYGELDRKASAFAARLLERAAPRRPVLLLVRPDAESVAALCGCLYAGAPCAPAPTPGRNGALGRLQAFAEASGADVAVASGELEHLREAGPGLEWLTASAAVSGPPAAPRALSDDLAILQFTSGSTREPRGVELTHANVTANLEMLRLAFEVDADSRFASWLPLFHDMGLAMLLMPLYFGRPGVLMAPLTFVRRPERWLRMVQDHRATISGAPNFAFDLCLTRVNEEALEGLDLSSWRTAFCGAEPVRRATLDGFAARFARYGLARSALYPCYGLAEAVCFVSGGRLVGSEEDEPGASNPIPCGEPAASSDLRIVDPGTGRPLEPGEVGEVWVAGPHVARGYRSSGAQDEATFGARLAGREAPYLRTGDLGQIDAAGRLVVLGRRKDVLIHRGENIHAGDLEALVAASHPGFGAVGAAFQAPTASGEGVVIVQEAASRTLVDAAAMRAAAAEALAAEYGLRVQALVLARRGCLPKTSSGKVRRGVVRQLYLQGEVIDLLCEDLGAEVAVS